VTAVLELPCPAPAPPTEFGAAALTATAPSGAGRAPHLYVWIGAGKKYWVSGKRLSHDDAWAGEVTRSGEWYIPAARNGEETVFTLDPYAALSKHMVGWVCEANEPGRSTASPRRQPDINTQVFLPIRAVDTNANTVTVSGRYEALAGEMQAPVGGGEPEPEPEDPVFAPNRFRVFAPPGTVTVGPAAGCVAVMGPHRQAHWVNAVSTRCLYKGYRYETPLAGVQGSEPGSGITARQEGLNFGGLYYTLHRHYDPVLMRFTTPDPAASPFYNLYHYAHNNPARYTDPDGEAVIVPIIGAAVAVAAILLSTKKPAFAPSPEWTGEEFERGWQETQESNDRFAATVAPFFVGGGIGLAVRGTTLAFGGSQAFATFMSVTAASSSASVTYQGLDTGEVDPSQVAGDTLIGLGSYGLLSRLGGGPVTSMMRAGGPATSVAAQRQALLNHVRNAGSLSEAKGIVFTARQMQARGYQLLDANLTYRGRQGIDLVFRKGNRYAVAEAKAGAGGGRFTRLATDRRGLQQGSRRWIEDRLSQYIETGGIHSALAQRLLAEHGAGRLRSFAGFYGNRRLIQLPQKLPNPWPLLPPHVR
jgi:RHS repeat-associated protein